MGGSLGLALRRRKFARVIGVGRDPKKLSAAKRRGTCDEVSTDLAAGVSRADIVVLCTSVSAILPTIRKILPHLKSGAVVTDIGSVKSDIVAGAENMFSSSSVQFIGGHPLAGSEKTGSENADVSLYQGATVVLCAGNNGGFGGGSGGDSRTLRPLSVLKSLWKSAGADCVEMGPEIHDLLVAQTSHLPHVLSAALVQLISGLARRDKNTPRLLAGSFRDMTRISDSAPEQWAEISSANQKFLTGALKSYRDILSRLIRDIERGTPGPASGQSAQASAWLPFFTAARKDRAALLAKKSRKA